MADDKNKDIIDESQDNIDESSLKQTVDSVSLEGIESLIPSEETKNTKESKDKTMTSLSGIDDISSYIQKQKQKADRISPELLTARDGTDLLSQDGVYAVVPHKKNDHKIVYLRKDAPKNLLEDPKQRKKGTEYKKNNMKIYDVHVDYAEHPTLLSPDGKPLDVRIIDEPKDLDNQLQAIRDGKGGGTNFMSPIKNETSKENDDEAKETKTSSPKNQKERKEKKSPKKVIDEKKELIKEDSTTIAQKPLQSLDDILPIPSENTSDTEPKSIETQKKQSSNEKKQSSLSLEDILPVGSKPKEDTIKDSDSSESLNENNNKNKVSLDDILPVGGSGKDSTEEDSEKNESTTSKKETTSTFSLDDILPKKEEEPSKQSLELPITSKESESDLSQNSNDTEEKASQDMLKSSEDELEIIHAQDEDKNISDNNTNPLDDTLDPTPIQEDIESPVINDAEDEDETPFSTDTGSEIDDADQYPEDDEPEVIEETKDSDQKGNLSEELDEELEEIELPSLDEFIPKEIPDQSLQDFTQESSIPQNDSKENTEYLEMEEDSQDKKDQPTSRAEGFSAEELLIPSDFADLEDKEIEKNDTPPVLHEETIPSFLEEPETMNEKIPESSEIKPSESIQEKPDEDSTDLIDLDDMTFEPITKNESLQPKVIGVHNDGILGNEENSSTKGKGNIGLLIVKIAVAIVLLGIAAWIVVIMLGGSKTPSNTPPTNPPTQENPLEEQPGNTPQEEPQEPEIGDTIDTDQQEQPIQPTAPIEPQEPQQEIQEEQIFTLPELIAKIEAQQSEARRLLNKAKLLNNREGIKFATAGFIKASKSLDEATQDPTITADQLQRDAERIDLYLGQAQAIVEK